MPQRLKLDPAAAVSIGTVFATTTAVAGLSYALAGGRSAVAAGVGALIVAAASAMVQVWQLRATSRSQRRIAHWLTRLASLDHHTLREDDPTSRPAIPAAPAKVQSALQRVDDRFVELGDELRQVEHARAACEIRANRALQEMRRIREILRSLSEPVFAVDRYNELVLVNESAEDLLGLDTDRDEHRVLDDVVRCERLLQLLEESHGRKSPTVRSSEVELPDESGNAHWFNVTVTPFTATSTARGDLAPNDPDGAVVVLRDISTQKAAQQRNATFVSDVSHEMKSPLAGIKAYVELLADGDADDQETRDECLNVINTQTDRLQRLIDNMLNLARIEAGVTKVEKTKRPLNEILDEAVQVMQPAAERKQIELRVDLSPLYLNVHVDRDLMLQATINLLSNAIKYTPDEGTVTLRSRMEDDTVRFEVEDTGVGLSEQDCEQVFEKFYRVAANSDMAQGTGLGLPLVKHIIEDVHGGRISVHSQLGRGSTFVATIPGAGRLNE